MTHSLAFVIGILVGVSATLGVLFIASLINWLLADHDRD